MLETQEGVQENVAKREKELILSSLSGSICARGNIAGAAAWNWWLVDLPQDHHVAALIGLAVSLAGAGLALVVCRIVLEAWIEIMSIRTLLCCPGQRIITWLQVLG